MRCYRCPHRTLLRFHELADRHDSLDAIEIAAAVDYAYQVRIEDVRGARSIMSSIRNLAEHIAKEKGWPS